MDSPSPAQAAPAEPAASDRTALLAADVLAVLPAAAVTIFWALSALFYGAYFPAAWYPAAIVGAVLCPLLLAAGWRLPTGTGLTSLGLLGAFVAWSALSIAWADAGGHALEATNKLVLGLAVAFVFAVTPWNERRARWIISGFVVGVTAACVGTFASATFSGNPTAYFIEGRFAEPMGYAGASAAFAAMTTGPALALSARVAGSLWSRTIFFAMAVIQLELGLLPQSRGVFLAMAGALVAVLLFSPNRGWVAIRAAAAAALVVFTVPPILHVYTVASEGEPVGSALHSAFGGLALAAGIALVVGGVLAYLESRRPKLTSPAVARTVGRASIGALGVVVLVVAIGLGGRIEDSVSSHWDSFKAGKNPVDFSSHLTSTGDPERYDYWRVAVDAADEHLLTGIGAGNFQDEYAIKRHEEKHSRYVHSFWLRALSETGIVGLLLIVGALGCGFWTVGSARRENAAGTQVLAAGAAAVTAAVFAHASIDWIEEFPAVLGPALAMLYLACRLARPPSSSDWARHGTRAIIGIVCAGIVLVGLVPAYLGLRFTERADAAWVTDPAAARDDLAKAAWLEPLSSQPYLTRGDIAVSLKRDDEAERAFRRAIEIEDNWYPHFQLALIASAQGRKQSALNQIAIALELDGADLLVKEVANRLRHGARLTPTEIGSQISQETSERFYRIR